MHFADAKRSLTVIWCLLALGAGGCADFGETASWLPFQKETSDELPGVPSPHQRIATLQELARKAPVTEAEERAEISARLAASMPAEEDPLIRAEMVRTLAEYPGAEAEQVLRAALSDPDADVRAAACEAWGKRGDATAAKLLGGVLGGDVDRDVRLAAARALGHAKDPAAVAALGEVLQDKDPAMQYRAVLSLRKITGKNLGNDVNRWREYVKSGPPKPAESISIAERLRRMSPF